jgi:drug/metabolite transporter (DMT)-like permease
VLAYGAYATRGKALRTGDVYPATAATAASFAAGLILLSPFLVGELLLVGTPELSLRGWLILLYLGVGASAAAIYINLIPVIGLLFSLAFGETVSAVQLLGGTLAIVGVLLSESARGRNSKKQGEGPRTSVSRPRARHR